MSIGSHVKWAIRVRHLPTDECVTLNSTHFRLRFVLVFP